MTTQTVPHAVPEPQDFPQVTDPYRRELLAHCYRMTGSVHDAEDLVQETYLRAWRAYHSFEGRSSVRTWLYRIATNVCLTALEGRDRRPLPAGPGAPSRDAGAPLEENGEIPWLEPVPDTMLDTGTAADPLAVVTDRDTIRLAFVAALQHLPARQRAVLILRDVLRWKAAEVAQALETTTASVNSALQRARDPGEGAPHRGHRRRADPGAEGDARPLRAGVLGEGRRAIVAMLTRDAIWEMPPFTGWYQGNENIGRSSTRSVPVACTTCGCWPPAPTAERRTASTCAARTAPSRRSTCRCSRSVPTGSSIGAFFEASLFALFGLPASADFYDPTSVPV